MNSERSWRPDTDIATLRQRAGMLRQIRQFFQDRSVLEVETPALSRAAVTDPAIHSMPVQLPGETCYLQTSPEFAMKRLLCAGSGDIYQICRVFRGAESGRYHNPEFSLLEWYRLGFDHHDLMRELDDLLHLLWPKHRQPLGQTEFISYTAMVERATSVPFPLLTPHTIEQVLRRHGHTPPQSMPDCLDSWLDLLMTHVIAPAFALDRFTAVFDYPASQAALARIRTGVVPVAERFEFYFGELELANGFHELQDAEQQRQRFLSDNLQRKQEQAPQMPLDERLIAALGAGLPDCAGVALGLDRLLMVLGEKSRINQVLAFSHASV